MHSIFRGLPPAPCMVYTNTMLDISCFVPRLLLFVYHSFILAFFVYTVRSGNLSVCRYVFISFCLCPVLLLSFILFCLSFLGRTPPPPRPNIAERSPKRREEKGGKYVEGQEGGARPPKNEEPRTMQTRSKQPKGHEQDGARQAKTNMPRAKARTCKERSNSGKQEANDNEWRATHNRKVEHVKTARQDREIERSHRNRDDDNNNSSSSSNNNNNNNNNS